MGGGREEGQGRDKSGCWFHGRHQFTFPCCSHDLPKSDTISPPTCVPRCLPSTRGRWEGCADTHLEVPIGCDAQPVAGPTEMLRHGRDEADLASEARDAKGLGKEGEGQWRKPGRRGLLSLLT